jgi:hypothetical protein
MLYSMRLIVTDGDAEPKREKDTAPFALEKRKPGNIGFVGNAGEYMPMRMNGAWSRRIGVVAAVLAALIAGAWFLLRGVAFWMSSPYLPLPYPADSPSSAMLMAVAATGCGLFLLVCALLLATGNKNAWMMFAFASLAATLLSAFAWWQSGVADWAGMAAALSLCLIAALPNVREGTLSPAGEKRV